MLPFYIFMRIEFTFIWLRAILLAVSPVFECNCFCFFVLTIIYCMFSAMASTLNFAITLNNCHFLLSYFFFLLLVILPIYLNIFSVLPIRNGCHFWIYVCGYQIPSELALIISIKDPFIKKLSFFNTTCNLDFYQRKGNLFYSFNSLIITDKEICED